MDDHLDHFLHGSALVGGRDGEGAGVLLGEVANVEVGDAVLVSGGATALHVDSSLHPLDDRVRFALNKNNKKQKASSAKV